MLAPFSTPFSEEVNGKNQPGNDDTLIGKVTVLLPECICPLKISVARIILSDLFLPARAGTRQLEIAEINVCGRRKHRVSQRSTKRGLPCDQEQLQDTVFF